MVRQILRLAQTPSRETYASLLFGLLPFASMCGFIVTSRAEPRSAMEAIVLDALDPFLLRIEDVTSWPGTEVKDGTSSTRYLYRLSKTALEILLNNSSDLYDWQFPFLPADLHLQRDDASTVLGTIAVHRRAWLEFDQYDLRTWKSTNQIEVTSLIVPKTTVPGAVQGIGVLTGENIGADLRADILGPFVEKMPITLRDSVSSYLSAGRDVLITAVTTHDQLGGGFEVAGGADILSDGTYCWRRDAANYVATHGVAIPEEAIEHFRAMNWSIPDLTETETDDIEEFLWVDF